MDEKKPINTKNVDKKGSMLLKCLSYDGITIDKLVEKTKLRPQIVTQELLMLELENKVAKIGVSSYALIK